MTCRQCGHELEDGSSFCRICGTAVQSTRTAPRHLTRLPDAGKLGGVCAGLAAYFGVDVSLVRFGWVLLSIVPGGIVGGLLAYIIAWAILPAAPGGLEQVPHTLHRSATNAKIAGVCGGVAELLGLDANLVRVAWTVLTIIPGFIVLGVLAYLVAWAVMPPGDVPALTPAPSHG